MRGEGKNLRKPKPKPEEARVPPRELLDRYITAREVYARAPERKPKK